MYQFNYHGSSASEEPWYLVWGLWVGDGAPNLAAPLAQNILEHCLTKIKFLGFLKMKLLVNHLWHWYRYTTKDKAEPIDGWSAWVRNVIKNKNSDPSHLLTFILHPCICWRFGCLVSVLLMCNVWRGSWLGLYILLGVVSLCFITFFRQSYLGGRGLGFQKY